MVTLRVVLLITKLYTQNNGILELLIYFKFRLPGLNNTVLGGTGNITKKYFKAFTKFNF